ncbi:MAG: hypothetical protein OEW05_03265 [Candidatus Aminicenantes bacterium]|nr:hypothetical protein [Candidatus Aminicenantes bacterium]
MRLQDMLVPYIVANALALVLLWLAAKKPKLARWVFGAIFVGAAFFNAYMAAKRPQAYVDSYGASAWFPIYREFIHGFFSRATALLVLLIAAGQAVCGVLLFTRRSYKLGALGAVIFLLAIAPLGLGSAFPSTLLMAVGLVLAMRKRG